MFVSTKCNFFSEEHSLFFSFVLLMNRGAKEPHFMYRSISVFISPPVWIFLSRGKEGCEEESSKGTRTKIEEENESVTR